MFPVDEPTASPTLPTPAAAGTEGYFTNGNPASGVPATILDADWLNMVQQELLNIVAAAGETPSKTTYNQVLQAILTLIGQPATNKVSGVVGQTRNLVIDLPASSATATAKADEIIVETALGGVRYCLSSFNESINIGTVGAGGMDVAGLPATATVAIYAIYNPTTGAEALLGWNASSAKAPEVYGGGAMPAGYIASSLQAVLLVTGGLFTACYVQDRHVTLNQTNQVNTSSSSTSNAQLVLGVPINAKNVDLNATFTSTTATNANVAIGATSAGALGGTSFQVSSGSAGAMQLRRFALRTAQTIWYSISNSAGTPQTIIALTGYEI